MGADCSLRLSGCARRADTDGQKWTRFDSGASIGGIWGTSQNVMVPTKLVHIVVGPGRRTWDQTVLKIMEDIKQNQYPRKFGDEEQVLFRRNANTKITALTTSIKSGWTDFSLKIKLNKMIQ